MRARLPIHALAWLAVLVVAGTAHAAGTLTPQGSADAPIEIRDHAVEIVIQEGFARTRVSQTFYNPNATALEGVYAFPIPRDASLSEMSRAWRSTAASRASTRRSTPRSACTCSRSAADVPGTA